LLASIAGGSTEKSPTYAKIGTVELYATPPTSVGEQAISLYGRTNEVNRLIDNMKALDQVGEGADQFIVYEVKYMDPRALKQDLENQMPGLQVSVAPANAGTPGLFKEESKKQEASGSSQTSETKSQSTSGSTEVKGDTGDLNGLGLPFTNSEKQAFPMRILMRGSKDKIEKALAYLTAVDVEPRQVALQLHVMDLSKEDAERIGIDWGLLTSAGLNFGRINQALGDSAATGGTVSSNAGLPSGKNLSVVATLDAIANNRNLIARPNLFAYDGRQSELFVGDVIRYIESIQSTQQGITVTTKELPIGVRLAVLPRVGGDGKITLDLRPVVSTLNGFTPVPGGGQLPQTSLRIAQNTLTMEDGETIAIGGLIQENDVKRVSGFPILKDLPILGKLLFSRTDNSKKRTELVFFLTAKMVTRENRVNAANPMANEPKKEGKKGKG
jgi:type II secretory pathway component GspD/PulD (secretin)